MGAHFGEKVYKCTLCKTTFNNKHQLGQGELVSLQTVSILPNVQISNLPHTPSRPPLLRFSTAVRPDGLPVHPAQHQLHLPWQGALLAHPHPAPHLPAQGTLTQPNPTQGLSHLPSYPQPCQKSDGS